MFPGFEGLSRKVTEIIVWENENKPNEQKAPWKQADKPNNLLKHFHNMNT